MPIRISHQPAFAAPANAAFTGGQGELLRYLQGLDLQYARMAQDDAQQMRSMQFAAAQQQNANQARLMDQMLGMNFSAQRDMWQAQQRQAEMVAERDFVKGRDAALAETRMAELRAREAADIEAMEREMTMRGRLALSEMDAEALSKGLAVFDAPAAARLSELDRAEQELMTEPKFDARQRQEGLARIQRERQSIRPRYLRPDEREQTMDEEFQTRVLNRPEGTYLRQPDGEWSFQPNKNEDPNTVRMEQVGKLNESRAKAITSYIEAQVKIRTAMTKVPGPPTQAVNEKTGLMEEAPGAEISVPAFSPEEAEQMLAPIRNDIANFTAEIERLKAETHEVADVAQHGQPTRIESPWPGWAPEAGGQQGGGMGGQLPMLPPEPQPAPQQVAAQPAMPQQQAQANPFAGMDDAQLKAFHDRALGAGDRAVAYAAQTEMQKRKDPLQVAQTSTLQAGTASLAEKWLPRPKTPQEAMALGSGALFVVIEKGKPVVKVVP